MRLGPCDVKLVGDPTGSTVIVLLHGYGADAEDLFALHQLLGQDFESPISFLFPEAFDPLFFGTQPMGRAWFPIDVMFLQRNIQAKNYQEIAHALRPPLELATKQFITFMQEVRSRFQRIVLGGFSQGSLMTLDYLAHPGRVDGIAAALLFSTSKSDHWTSADFAKSPLPIFQSHGRLDPVLPVELARETCDLLKEAGCRVEYDEFAGGHEIPMATIKRAAYFLRANLP